MPTATDKAEFTRLLKERLDAEGVPYATVEYSGSLEVENLAGYTPDVQPAVYIPESGTRHEFLRYAPVLEKIKEELATPENMALWGYPEFVTFKGENRAALHSLNTTIYSRYYTNDNDYTLRSLRSRYKDLYGQEMTDAFPLQGVQGYDAQPISLLRCAAWRRATPCPRISRERRVHSALSGPKDCPTAPDW